MALTVDDLRGVIYTALGPVADAFPFHVIGVVDALDGTLTHDKWMVASHILKSLLSVPGDGLTQASKDIRKIGLRIGSACVLMSSASFSGLNDMDRAVESAMEMVSGHEKN